MIWIRSSGTRGSCPIRVAPLLLLPRGIVVAVPVGPVDRAAGERGLEMVEVDVPARGGLRAELLRRARPVRERQDGRVAVLAQLPEQATVNVTLVLEHV